MIDLYYLALSYYSFSKSDLIRFIEVAGSPKELLESNQHTLITRYELTEKSASRLLAKREEYLQRAERELEQLTDYGITLLTYDNSGYPTALTQMSDAPIVLYVLGDSKILSEDGQLWLSVVGTKSCSDAGRITTSKLLEDIAAHNSSSIIFAGVSDGIDKFVHRAANRVGLRSVATLPYALDMVSSEEVRRTVQEVISGGGAVISEYPLTTHFYSKNYKESNRIIAGISHATVLIEAPLESNTLSTLTFADSYQREVFAYPGRAIDVGYAGCNAAIKSGKAQLITSFTDIAAAMGIPLITPSQSSELNIEMSDDMRKIFDILADGAEHSDEEIMIKSELDAQQFNSLISLMELEDYIIPLKGRMYIRKI